MTDALRRINLDLQREIKRLQSAVSDALGRAPKELYPYAGWLQERLTSLGDEVGNTLYLLQIDGVAERAAFRVTVLDRTTNLRRELDLIDSAYVSPFLRADGSDRLCLRLLRWLHDAHPDTHGLPVVHADGGVQVLPPLRGPMLFYLPASVQRGLLYLPLVFHEFGHGLYVYHQREMDDLVGTLQTTIRDALDPASQPHAPSDADRRRRATVVERWYDWTQELYCDAVGLTIGGAAYLHAFSQYLGTGRKSYVGTEERLAVSQHPTAWLRVDHLVRRARDLGFDRLADDLAEHWEDVAGHYGVERDHAGFYHEGWEDDVYETVSDLLVETDPFSAASVDAVDPRDFTALAARPTALLNAAWDVFIDDAEEYPSWERQAIAAFVSDGLASS